MRGHIRQRSKGSWSIVIDVGRDPETGKRRQQWHTVHGTKREAEAKLRELLQSLETGSYVKPTKLTVGEWLEQWLESHVAVHCSPRTGEGYQSIVRRHLIRALGAIPLTQLQPQHLRSYYARALFQGGIDGEERLSRRTILHHHRLLHKALEDAVKEGLVSRNVAKAVDPPRPERSNMATLAPEDVPKFLEVARETPYYVLFYTALYTGMRRGELLGLRWCDVDLDLTSLSVV